MLSIIHDCHNDRHLAFWSSTADGNLCVLIYAGDKAVTSRSSVMANCAGIRSKQLYLAEVWHAIFLHGRESG